MLEVVAGVAAWSSKARGSAKVQVDYCPASDRKPRGAPAGLVELRRWKSVRVKPALPEGGEEQNSE